MNAPSKVVPTLCSFVSAEHVCDFLPCFLTVYQLQYLWTKNLKVGILEAAFFHALQVQH
jgi:hypothetical protein